MLLELAEMLDKKIKGFLKVNYKKLKLNFNLRFL